MLVFGESVNDTQCVRALLGDLQPHWHVEARTRPPVLIKDAKEADIPSRVRKITALVRAASTDADVIAVFVHQDCDQLEDAHVHLAQETERAFKAEGYPIVAVVPAWEMEAWLLLWPDAFPLHVSSWRPPDKYRQKRVGMIVNAKEELDRLLSRSKSKRGYKESDAPAILAIVADKGWARSPRAVSHSYELFVHDVDALATAIAP